MSFIVRNDELFIKVDSTWLGPLSTEGVAAFNMVEQSDQRTVPDRMSNTTGTEAVGVHRGTAEYTQDITEKTKPLWFCGGKELDYVHWRWVGSGRRTRKPASHDETARTGWSKETGKIWVLGYRPPWDSGGRQHAITGKFARRATRADLP